MKKRLPWIAAAVILVITFGTMYTLVQQAQRSDANYPQIQIAEDTAAALNAGDPPQALISGKVNLATSLAPFIIIYTHTGQVVASSGYLNGTIPTVPFGMLTNAANKPYNFVSWQPASGVRIAAVNVVANNYYILSGRSLTEIEKNETHSMQLAALGGVLSLAILAGAYVLTPK